MALVRKKLDDKILKTLRELVAVGGNKECFDCGQKGPTYINMTIGSFVCTSCSGILRGLTPPHRVKSISMATFTQEEIEFLKQNGNDNCSRTWLGLWDPKRAIKQEHRDFMIDKYEKQRYYLEPASPLKSLPTNSSSSLTSLPGGANNNGSSSNSTKNANESLVPLKTPTLTPPPAKLRLNRNNSGSCNGLNSVSSSSSNGQQQQQQFQQQFSPDDSGFFGADPLKILPPTPQKNHALQRKNGIKVKPGGGPKGTGAGAMAPTFERNQKNGLLNTSNGGGGFAGSNGDINANNGNKFTPDADFVADFGSANIVNNVVNGGSHYGSTNSLGKQGSSSENGSCYGQPNGKASSSTREMENFADFEHNPIFNSAENMKSFFSSSSFDSSTTTNSVSSTASVQSLTGLSDPFANFYTPHTTAPAAAATTGSNSNVSTPTASSSGGTRAAAGGYTCISPDESLSYGGQGKAANNNAAYGCYYGGTFTAGPASQYAYQQQQQSFYAGSPGGWSTTGGTMAQVEPLGGGRNPTEGFGANAAANHYNNNTVSNDGTSGDTVQWNFWQQFGNNNSCWVAESDQPLFQQQQQQQQFRNGNNVLQMMTSPRHTTVSTSGQTANLCSDPYRWSLPMPLGANGTNGTSSSSSSSTNNNTSMHSTPSVDRYAALKDLDEQFREIKLEQQAEANNNTVTSHALTNGHGASDSHLPQGSATANPFKTANPFQQQPQQPQQTMAWPISAGMNGGSHLAEAANGTNGTGFYATSPYQGGFGAASSPQVYNGGGGMPNGYHLPAGAYRQPNGNGYAVMPGVNGVGGGQFNGAVNGGVSMLGGVPTASNPVHHFGNFGNPFMATGTTAGNSNNPFL